ncbi:hypothetical protein GLOIN_2v1648556 [Rhizophagus irregularis DAOM 181602=DAOM 197198]|uniref:Uncharacterized protein n=1 Tax=Rhizophagus irregularis (strain DAOM 181602 / DAOM 197198 / MUCL 43194) TaxID=747089 RepID=A0A2P4PPP2_RHIID|nr:hypothetical protein GLOIN_2v1648556 [Rhizophagus irregularis DAOM 181602=DAOM 197198]POG67369.1 hypothetical protein GLOIN_2v1648556 [Rhizophagus irregularis DAOM 181602=DAOM 197198]|eukprot:XP_025174235.1 hypothetical protein GLOIN_2v1648556 [Rhizophagus irregularis DAOM 181602=DAOM 197198]
MFYFLVYTYRLLYPDRLHAPFYILILYQLEYFSFSIHTFPPPIEIYNRMIIYHYLLILYIHLAIRDNSLFNDK